MSEMARQRAIGTGRGLPSPDGVAGCFLLMQPPVLLTAYPSVVSANPPVTPPPPQFNTAAYVPTGASTVYKQESIDQSWRLHTPVTSHQLSRSAWPQRAERPVHQRHYRRGLLQTVATHYYPTVEQVK